MYKYNLKIPICQACHAKVHSHKKKGQVAICYKLKIPYHQIRVIMRKPEKQWCEYEHSVMDRVQKYMQKKIEGWEG